MRFGVEVSRVDRQQPTGPVTLTLSPTREEEELVADELLVATGRRPATGGLGLETVGLNPATYVSLDDSLQVPGHDGLYAVGDVTGRELLTHQGTYQARVAAADAILARMAGQQPPYLAQADAFAVPQVVVFNDPEIAAVGLTSAEAAARTAGEDRRVRNRPDRRRRSARRGLRRPRRAGRRRGRLGGRRRNLRQPGYGRAAARGHPRGRRTGAAGPVAPRRAIVPDPEVWLRLLEELGW